MAKIPAKKPAAKKRPARKPKPKANGRPSTYTEKLADAICIRLAEGESLATIVKDDKMPASSTVYKWLLDNKVFSERYTRARELQVETHLDQVMDIADNRDGDYELRVAANGKERIARVTEVIQRSALRIEARIKMAEKMFPAKYRPQQQVDTTNATKELTDDQLMQRRNELLAKQGLSPPELKVIKNDKQ